MTGILKEIKKNQCPNSKEIQWICLKIPMFKYLKEYQVCSSGDLNGNEQGAMFQINEWPQNPLAICLWKSDIKNVKQRSRN